MARRKKNHTLKVFGIDVSKLLHSTEDGDVKIKPEDYRYSAEFKPSRNIRLLYKGESINLAICEEVPKRPKSDDTPPGPGLRLADNGGKLKGGQHLSNPYKSLPAHLLVEWDERTQKLWLNKDHQFVREYFTPGSGFSVGSPRHRKSLELYGSWHSMAYSLSQAYDKAVLVSKCPDGEISSDPLNFLINQTLHAQIASCPLMLKQIEKISKLIDNNSEQVEDEE